MALVFQLLFSCICTQIQLQLASDLFSQISLMHFFFISTHDLCTCRIVDVVLRVVPTFTNFITVAVYKDINIAGYNTVK